MEKTVYYEWVDVARGIGIFLVVLGHAIADIVHNGPMSRFSTS